jgi:hypothetical protein
MIRNCLLGHAQSLCNPVLGYAAAVHADVSHRFLLLLTEKTMIDKLRRWLNRWVSKPVPSWLPNTGRVGPFLGGGIKYFAPVFSATYYDGSLQVVIGPSHKKSK